MVRTTILARFQLLSHTHPFSHDLALLRPCHAVCLVLRDRFTASFVATNDFVSQLSAKLKKKMPWNAIDVCQSKGANSSFTPQKREVLPPIDGSRRTKDRVFSSPFVSKSQNRWEGLPPAHAAPLTLWDRVYHF